MRVQMGEIKHEIRKGQDVIGAPCTHVHMRALICMHACANMRASVCTCMCVCAYMCTLVHEIACVYACVCCACLLLYGLACFCRAAAHPCSAVLLRLGGIFGKCNYCTNVNGRQPSNGTRSQRRRRSAIYSLKNLPPRTCQLPQQYRH